MGTRYCQCSRHGYFSTSCRYVCRQLISLIKSLKGSFLDKYGRRRLLVIGTIILTISLACLSASLFFMNENLHLQGIMAVICTLSFVAGFAVGFGAVIW